MSRLFNAEDVWLDPELSREARQPELDPDDEYDKMKYNEEEPDEVDEEVSRTT
jgi:hypothetical protein